MENDEGTERTPLIQPTPQPASLQPRNSGGSSVESRRPIIAVAPVNADEQPVPLAPSAMSAVGAVPTINCRICRSLIGLDGKLGNHVVKCPTCNEATPIRAAPEGKRYVRCPCGCLLVCKQAASRISCPRDHCRRVLNLSVSVNAPASEVEASSRPPGNGSSAQLSGRLVVSHLQCPSCCLSFLLQSDPSTPYARCPHCSARAVLNKSYTRNRSIVFAVLFFLCIAGGVTALILTFDFTFKEKHYAMIALWAGLFAIGFLFAVMALYFACMRVAKVMTSATSSYGAPNARYAYA